jgi:hypothetical protein
VVEHDLAKVGVEGSNPFARSRFFKLAKFDQEPAASAGFLFLGPTSSGNTTIAAATFTALYAAVQRAPRSPRNENDHFSNEMTIFPIYFRPMWPRSGPFYLTADVLNISAA